MKQNIALPIQNVNQNSPKATIAEYELNTLVHQAAIKLKDLASEKNIRLRLIAAANYTSVWCDFQLATSLIPIFIIKVLCCALEGSEVEIRLNCTPKKWSITFGKLECPDFSKSFDERWKVCLQPLLSIHSGQMEFDAQEKMMEITFPIMPPVACPDEKTDSGVLPRESKERKYIIFILAEDTAYGKFLKEWLDPLYTVTLFDNIESMQKELRDKCLPELILLEGSSTTKWMDEFCHKLKTDVQTNHIRLIRLENCADAHFPVANIHSSLADACLERPCNLSAFRAEIARQFMLGEYAEQAYYKLLQDRDAPPRRCRDTKFEEATQFMSKVRRYICENISQNDLTVERISAEMGMSRSTLYLKIRDITGMYPHALIVNERIRVAKRLLEEGTYLVSEVGWMVGISDLKHFCNVFKKAMGIPPSEYMRRNSR